MMVRQSHFRCTSAREEVEIREDYFFDDDSRQTDIDIIRDTYITVTL